VARAQVVGGTDPREPGADDEDVEVLVRHGGRAA